jgi:ketosteroid isomerase-like protein
MDSANALTDSSVMAGLQRLLDEDAIRRVHLDYCHGLDRRDWDLVRSCYHPDAVDYHGPFSGNVDEFIEWAITLADEFPLTTHFVGNQIVDVDGDVAWHEAYCQASHRVRETDARPALNWIVNVRYIDRMERRNGEWKIADRLVVHDSDRRELVAGNGEIGEGWFAGRAAPEDPSYNRSLTWAEFLARHASGG